MFLFLLALQAVDHGGRDLTIEGLVEMAGPHEAVRIFTVTRAGEVVGDASGAKVHAQAVVVDGVVAGGPNPVVLEAGEMQAGRYPVLLSPPDGTVAEASPTLKWYPASQAPGLEYAAEITGPDGSHDAGTGVGLTAWDLPRLSDGAYRWHVEASSALGTYGSEEWAFTLGRAPTPGPSPDPVAGPISERPFRDGSKGRASRSCLLFFAQNNGPSSSGAALLVMLCLLLGLRLRGLPVRSRP